MNSDCNVKNRKLNVAGLKQKELPTYNRIINASLTDQILKQRGIEATMQLSESANSKVVVIGSGKDGLPLILGNN